MTRHLNPDGSMRSTAELIAVILEYEHALEHVTHKDHHTSACTDCQRLAQSALDGVNETGFLEMAEEIIDPPPPIRITKL